jgi:hypothetical protein
MEKQRWNNPENHVTPLTSNNTRAIFVPAGDLIPVAHTTPWILYSHSGELTVAFQVGQFLVEWNKNISAYLDSASAFSTPCEYPKCRTLPLKANSINAE